MIKSKNELISDEMSQKIIDLAEDIVTTTGTHDLTVRKILNTLGITNRVFYNRFHNINEVLDIVYNRTSLKVRQTLIAEFDNKTDFFTYVVDVVANSLIISYDTKMQFNQQYFENDSLSQSNYGWWTSEIKKLIDYAISRGFIKDVDSDIMSYAIWCFCRGYNADAVGRNIPKDEAVKNFKYSFSILLDGLKNS